MYALIKLFTASLSPEVSLETFNVVTPSSSVFARLRFNVIPAILVISEPTVFEEDIIEVPFIVNKALFPSSCASVNIFVETRFPSSSHSDSVKPITSVKLLVPASILIKEAPSILDVMLSFPVASSQYA